MPLGRGRVVTRALPSTTLLSDGYRPNSRFLDGAYTEQRRHEVALSPVRTRMRMRSSRITPVVDDFLSFGQVMN